MVPRPHDRHARALCVRTVDPAAAHLFDAFAFEANGPWHHVALFHSSQQLALSVDGRLVQRFWTPAAAAAELTASTSTSTVSTLGRRATSTVVSEEGFGFPSNVSWSTPLVGVLGGTGQVTSSGRTTAFSGQVGGLVLWDGLVAEAHIAQLVEEVCFQT